MGECHSVSMMEDHRMRNSLKLRAKCGAPGVMFHSSNAIILIHRFDIFQYKGTQNALIYISTITTQKILKLLINDYNTFV